MAPAAAPGSKSTDAGATPQPKRLTPPCAGAYWRGITAALRLSMAEIFSHRSRRPGKAGKLAGLAFVAVVFLTGAARAFDTVILDAGHGDHDRGASIGYVYEKHLCLDTARRVERLLKQAGLKVVLTRSTDEFITLQNRADMGNSRRNAIFVSIHYNYSRGGSGHGVETFYHFEKSYLLAAYIQAYLLKSTGLANRGVKHASYFVIRKTTRNPAVLVECGFVSNSAERQKMMDGAFRAKIAEGIAQGIVGYKRSR
ncbi:MAG TPA: N-acetylmuramoyl-L-alanine amidase [Verrucomicrobiales bacterium]|nr:N-acetylmuramoyl-L-alanine amidase [Verrucomicrobiales bacterium]